MKLQEFLNQDMEVLYKIYKGKIFTIIHKQNIPTDYIMLDNSSIVFMVINKDLFHCCKSKVFPLKHGPLDLNKTNFETILREWKEEGYLIVGEENIL